MAVYSSFPGGTSPRGTFPRGTSLVFPELVPQGDVPPGNRSPRFPGQSPSQPDSGRFLSPFFADSFCRLWRRYLLLVPTTPCAPRCLDAFTPSFDSHPTPSSLTALSHRSNEEEIRHFPCGTNPLPIRTRAEILPEGGPRCCPKPPGRAVILPQGSGEGRDSAPKEAKCAKCPKTPQRAACSAYDPFLSRDDSGPASPSGSRACFAIS